MEWTKEGLVFNITSPDCDDAIAFEKMMGHDREEQRKQIERLTDFTKMKFLVQDVDGNWTEI